MCLKHAGGVFTSRVYFLVGILGQTSLSLRTVKQLMSLIFSEYQAVLNDCKRIMTSKDPTKWTLSGLPENYSVYVDRFIIGQTFAVLFKKHKSNSYYCFSEHLFKDVHEINHFIQKFMPFGTYEDNIRVPFTPLTHLEINKMLYESGNIVWYSFESGQNTASIRIEPTNNTASIRIEPTNNFKVSITVYVTDITIYRDITMLLAFLDSDKSQASQLSKYVLTVNGYLNKHLGLADLATIVFQFLLVR